MQKYYFPPTKNQAKIPIPVHSGPCSQILKAILLQLWIIEMKKLRQTLNGFVLSLVNTASSHDLIYSIITSI